LLGHNRSIQSGRGGVGGHNNGEDQRPKRAPMDAPMIAPVDLWVAATSGWYSIVGISKKNTTGMLCKHPIKEDAPRYKKKGIERQKVHMR